MTYDRVLLSNGWSGEYKGMLIDTRISRNRISSPKEATSTKRRQTQSERTHTLMRTSYTHQGKFHSPYDYTRNDDDKSYYSQPVQVLAAIVCFGMFVL